MIFLSIIYDLIIYVTIIFFLIFIRFYRFGQKAKELDNNNDDNNTTQLLAISFVLSMFFLFIGPILNYFNFATLRPEFFFFSIGFVCMIFGMLLRIVSVRTLGNYYTSTLQTLEHQTIINKGIYRYIRHPGYLGNIILFIGSAIAITNIFITFIIIITIIPSYLRRVKYEELMLERKFDEQYRIYKSKTKKFIPLLF